MSIYNFRSLESQVIGEGKLQDLAIYLPKSAFLALHESSQKEDEINWGINTLTSFLLDLKDITDEFDDKLPFDQFYPLVFHYSDGKVLRRIGFRMSIIPVTEGGFMFISYLYKDKRPERARVNTRNAPRTINEYEPGQLVAVMRIYDLQNIFNNSSLLFYQNLSMIS